MPSNTTYKPLRATDLDANKVNANAQGVTGTVNFGATQNIDYTLVDDCLITGVIFFTNNAAFGDYVQLQVVDVSGIIAPAGTVLLQVATNWYVCPGQLVSVEFQYPAKIIAGLVIRAVYTSAASAGITNVYLNYKLHKCLT